MRHALLVTMLAMKAVPTGSTVPHATRALAGVVMAWLDRRRRRIDDGSPA